MLAAQQQRWRNAAQGVQYISRQLVQGCAGVSMLGLQDRCQVLQDACTAVEELMECCLTADGCC